MGFLDDDRDLGIGPRHESADNGCAVIGLFVCGTYDDGTK